MTELTLPPKTSKILMTEKNIQQIAQNKNRNLTPNISEITYMSMDQMLQINQDYEMYLEHKNEERHKGQIEKTNIKPK